MTGLHLAQYRIDAELGRGGMGIVYHATDTKLKRPVALKVLPASALASHDDRARFFREAQAAAQLSHPNIATVYGIDEAVPHADGREPQEGAELRPFIAMEFIEGETLQERVGRGPLKLAEAVSIAAQVAEALKAAHARQIVHRDIKSANVMLTTDGVAKVLDFGLAKTTATTQLTRQGTTVGTVAYMSPEQARGEEVDGRTDLYSLGIVVYEMAAGKLPFAGPYEQAVLYSVMNEPPEPLTAVRTGVPMELERIVNKLLAKEADLRHQSAADLLADLKALDLNRSGTVQRGTTVVTPTTAPIRSVGIPRWVWGAMAGVAMIAAGAGWLLRPANSAEPAEPMHLAIDLPFAVADFTPAWSPDGMELYYLARASEDGETHVRRYSLRNGQSEAVPGTEGSFGLNVSPDGRWLVFRDAARSQWRRVLRTGGAPSDIAGAASPVPWAAYGRDGRFYFTNPGLSIASVGEQGDVIVHTQRDSSMSLFLMPSPSPVAQTVFFAEWTLAGISLGTYRLKDEPPGYERVSEQYTYVGLLDNGYALVLPAGPPTEPVAVAPIDLETGRMLGPAVPLGPLTAGAVTRAGHFVYRERGESAATAREPLYRLESDGSLLRLADSPARSIEFAAARRRNAVVFEAGPDNPAGMDLYVMDLDSGVSTRLTRGAENLSPEWSPDDRYVYYRSRPDPSAETVIMRRRADASEPAELVLSDSASVSHPALTADGSSMLFSRSHGSDTNLDLYRIPLGNTLPLDMAEARVVTATDASERNPDLSPDDRYVVLRSGDAIVVRTLEGQSEVEVAASGTAPIWSPDGRWIYYVRPALDELYRVEVTADPSFRVLGRAERVFQTPGYLKAGIHPDGSVLIKTTYQGQDTAEGKVWLVLNFVREVERMAPRDR